MLSTGHLAHVLQEHCVPPAPQHSTQFHYQCNTMALEPDSLSSDPSSHTLELWDLKRNGKESSLPDHGLVTGLSWPLGLIPVVLLG